LGGLQKGDILGHEFMGIVEDVGDQVIPTVAIITTTTTIWQYI
jgi:threonine dehydrogenase-like Zn-dependent dehydrogenase